MVSGEQAALRPDAVIMDAAAPAKEAADAAVGKETMAERETVPASSRCLFFDPEDKTTAT